MAYRSATSGLPFATPWAACDRCGARVQASTRRREKMTGLMVCTSASGRDTQPCFDPWHPSLDFQLAPDNSVNPPYEPRPVRWGNLFRDSDVNPDDWWWNGQPLQLASEAKPISVLKPVDYRRIDEQPGQPGTQFWPQQDQHPYHLAQPGQPNPGVRPRDQIETVDGMDFDGVFVPSADQVKQVPPATQPTFPTLFVDFLRTFKSG